MRYWSIGIGVLIVAAVALWQVRAGDEPRPKAEGRADDTLVKRGEYLVTQVAGCTHCHTPQNARGAPDKARQLQGAELPIRPKKETKNWADKSPDITHSGLAGKWSEADMVKFLTTAHNPDGEGPTPPMPAFHLHEEDARAVAAYLRSLPGKRGRERK